MELKILTPEDKFLKVIDFNMDELKVALTDKLEKYKGLVYDDTQIATAKTDRATLNKFKKALDDKRIEIKKQLLEPYDSFETRIKEIITMVDYPVLEIDKQVKAFEEQQRIEKKTAIESYFEKNVVNVKNILKSIDRIWSDKWLNATVKMKDVEKEIDAAIQVVITNLDIIKEFNSEFEAHITEVYTNTLDFSAAMKEKAKLESDKEKFEARVKQETERLEKDRAEKQRIEAERLEKEKLEAEIKAKAVVKNIEPVVVTPPMKEVVTIPPVVEVIEQIEDVTTEEVIETVDIRLFIKASQKPLFKVFLNENNIKYSNVPK